MNRMTKLTVALGMIATMPALALGTEAKANFDWNHKGSVRINNDTVTLDPDKRGVINASFLFQPASPDTQAAASLEIEIGSQEQGSFELTLESRSGDTRRLDTLNCARSICYNNTLSIPFDQNLAYYLNDEGVRVSLSATRGSGTLVMDKFALSYQQDDSGPTPPSGGISAADDSAQTLVSQLVSIPVLANDDLAAGDNPSISDSGTPADGWTYQSGKQIVYTPNEGFVGIDSFRYTVRDDSGDTASATVTVKVDRPAAMNPVLSDDTITAYSGQAITIDVLRNDDNGQGGQVGLVLDDVSSPKKGSTYIDNNRVVYQSRHNFTGRDRFYYYVTNSTGIRQRAQVTVTVQNVPVVTPQASADTASTQSGEAVTVYVLRNDDNGGGDQSGLQIVDMGSPSNGWVYTSNDAIVYTPYSGFVGSDSFYYEIQNASGNTDTAWVNVTIDGDLSPVTIANNDAASTQMSQSIAIDVLSNDEVTHGDASTLRITATGDAISGQLNVNGAQIIYTPRSTFVGTDRFTYTTTDASGSSDSATVSLQVLDSTNPTDPISELVLGDTFYWQLQGNLDLQALMSRNATTYGIDLEDNENSNIMSSLQANGKKVVCYFSAGSYEQWRSDAGQFNESDLGLALGDWPGEYWLDVRSSNVRNIMKARLDRAVAAGCDAVEPDNVDGYQNLNGVGLSEADQLDYLTFLANEAHNRKLSIGLKNSVGLIQQANNSGKLMYDLFDWALNEECYDYDECDTLSSFINVSKPVFIAMYNDAERQAQCADSTAKGFMLAHYDANYNLDGSRYLTCD